MGNLAQHFKSDPAPTPLTLRDYQLECLEAIAQAEARGVRRQLVTLPTGTGKTIVFAELIQRRPGRALVLAHRDELIEQAVAKIRLMIPGAAIGVIKAERNEILFPVTVASIQTISRERRLDVLPRDFSTVVIDEAHHSAADSYLRVVDAVSSSDPLIVGFTATADRGDRQGLDCVFNEIVFTRNILEMIRAGYLSDLQAKQIHLKADFSQLHKRAGEFVTDEVEQMLRDADILQHGVKAYREHAPGRKALLFLPTVRLAHEMAAAFENAGIASAAIDAATDIDVRRETLQQFSRGDIQVLSNCMVLTEGYDEPSADCIIIARPTASRSLYTQMVGRGTRLHPGKDDCLILDFVGVTTRHDLITAASLFGVTPKPGETICEALEAQEAEERERQEQRGRLVADVVDIFKRARLHWIRAGDAFTLSMGSGMVLLKPDGAAWTAFFHGADRTRRLIADKLPLSYAQGAAEDFARKQGIALFMQPDAAWRKRPASDKQIAALRKMQIDAPPTLTAGEASDLMTVRIASRCS